MALGPPDFADVYSSLVSPFAPRFHLLQDLHQISKTGRPNIKVPAHSQQLYDTDSCSVFFFTEKLHVQRIYRHTKNL